MSFMRPRNIKVIAFFVRISDGPQAPNPPSL
jgi:hypothetical protein